jgi:hypothetical protein
MSPSENIFPGKKDVARMSTLSDRDAIYIVRSYVGRLIPENAFGGRAHWSLENDFLKFQKIEKYMFI